MTLGAEQLSYILGILGLMGIIFTAYRSLTKPQIDNDKKDALLAQQIQWMVEGTDRRFKEMQENINNLLLQSNNHIHTVDTKVDILNTTISDMGNQVTRLATIIDERIPKH